MVQPNDFVYQQVYKGAIAKGAHEPSAHRQAVLALEKFKKGQFKKPVELIDNAIKEAVRLGGKK